MDNANPDQYLVDISNKVTQLNTVGLTRNDREVLKDRLEISWGEREEISKQESHSTRWRKTRLKKTYEEIQDASQHIFLPTILVISPTRCVERDFDIVLNRLTSLVSYEPYHLKLNATVERFFESIAAEGGFASSRRYLSFMDALFPRNYEFRQIQLAYSHIPLDNIETFLQILREAIISSKQWKAERQRGEKTSQVMTGLAPTGDKDCCYTINVGREDFMRGIGQLELT